jgi:signal transduction histidine kinase
VLRVTVRDDGRGLPKGHRAGVGLGSMRERAAELGGICVVSGLPDAGTQVEVMLPLSPTGMDAGMSIGTGAAWDRGHRTSAKERSS